MQLHELEYFEHVFEFEQPLLSLVSKEYLNLVAFTALLDCGVTNLIETLLANDSYFRHKSCIVLQDVNDELLWPTVAINAPFAHTELQTGKMIFGDSVFDS